MSKTDNKLKKDNEDEIYLYMDKAKKSITQILKSKIKNNKETTEKILKSIFESILVNFNKIYKDTINIYEPNSVFIIEGNSTFKNFIRISYSVPLYQTLGDTLGYYNGNRKFNYSDPNIGPEYSNELLYQFIALGGVNDINIKGWRVSYISILYLETYKILIKGVTDLNVFGADLKLAYLGVLSKLENRHPGEKTIQSLLIQQNIEWNKLPYDASAIGAGAVVRAGCIGLFFPGKQNRQKLVALAIECSRITHNSAASILGCIVAALFTAYAIEKVNINHWPHKFMKLAKSNIIDEYLEASRPNEYHLYVRDKVIYLGQWEKYINMRFIGIEPKKNIPMFRNIVTRIDYFAKNFSKGHINNPGSNADDSVIIAYDALLESDGIFEKMIVYSILHTGDADCTGSIAFSWYAGYYHSYKVNNIILPKISYLELEKEIREIQEQANQDILIKIFYYYLYVSEATKIINKL